MGKFRIFPKIFPFLSQNRQFCHIARTSPAIHVANNVKLTVYHYQYKNEHVSTAIRTSTCIGSVFQYLPCTLERNKNIIIQGILVQTYNKLEFLQEISLKNHYSPFSKKAKMTQSLTLILI